MLYFEKTQNIFDLLDSLDSILLNNKNVKSSMPKNFSIYEISRELYYLSSHRYIDSKDYLFKLEMRFSHYIQLLHIKPYLQLNFHEKTGLSISKLKNIKKIISFLNNPILPKCLKQFLIVIIYFLFN
jgi:hypothetical protein